MAREPSLDESTVARDPFELFAAWYAAANASVAHAAAMVVATSTPDGRPSARVVLLRGFDARGFVFFTNYESRKATELEVNARAALVFHWAQLDRQVRVEGAAQLLGDDESDAYFAHRPRGHRIGAWASPQSRPIPDRADLSAGWPPSRPGSRRRSRCRARRSGAATAWSPRRSSSGSTAPTASTTASGTAAPRTVAGRSTGWRPDR
jgi:pyridoxamine-phosphate oxidase